MSRKGQTCNPAPDDVCGDLNDAATQAVSGPKTRSRVRFPRKAKRQPTVEDTLAELNYRHGSLVQENRQKRALEATATRRRNAVYRDAKILLSTEALFHIVKKQKDLGDVICEHCYKSMDLAQILPRSDFSSPPPKRSKFKYRALNITPSPRPAANAPKGFAKVVNARGASSERHTVPVPMPVQCEETQSADGDEEVSQHDGDENQPSPSPCASDSENDYTPDSPGVLATHSRERFNDRMNDW